MNPTGVVAIKVPYTLFGAGALRGIADVVKELGSKKPLVVTDKGLVAAGIIESVQAALGLGGFVADVFDEVEPEAPFNIIANLRSTILDNGYDLLLGVGGGSTMDTTKAAGMLAGNPKGNIEELKLNSVLVTIAGRTPAKPTTTILVPTTSGTGSEWSNVAVMTTEPPDDRNFAFISNSILPDAAIIDPELTRDLPPRIVADSGMDALTHAISAYTSSLANVYADMCASTAIKLITKSLRSAYADPAACTEDRYQLSLASSLAMLAAWVAGNGAEHMINHALHQKHVSHSHGARVGVLLPYVMEYNLASTPERFADIAQLLGEDTACLSVTEAAMKSVEAVRGLLSDLEMPLRLGDLGLSEADIPAVVEEYMTYWKPAVDLMCPRLVGKAEVTEILSKAL